MATAVGIGAVTSTTCTVRRAASVRIVSVLFNTASHALNSRAIQDACNLVVGGDVNAPAYAC